MNDLILLMGLPGSGKSTYATTLLTRYPNAALICPDTLREEVTGSESDLSRDGFIWTHLIPIRMNGAALNQRPIIFDATMVSRKARKPIIAHAKELGYRVAVHVVRTSFDECVKRNASRTRQVPVEVIERMRDRWADPTLDEGIDEIVSVGEISLDAPPQSRES